MKKKKFLSLILTCISVSMLVAGCGKGGTSKKSNEKASDLVKKMLIASNSITSSNVDLSLDIDGEAKMSMMSLGGNLACKVIGEFTSGDSTLAKLDYSIKGAFFDQKLDESATVYVEDKDNTTTLYMQDKKSKEWVKTVQDMKVDISNETVSEDDINSMDLSIFDGFKIKQEGSNYVIKGKVTGEDIYALASSSGKLEDIDNKEALKSIEGIDNVLVLDVTIKLNKDSYLPTEIIIDFKNSDLSYIANSLYGSSSEDSEDMDIDIDMKTLKLGIKLSNTNKVSSIEIPQDVLNGSDVSEDDITGNLK